MIKTWIKYLNLAPVLLAGFVGIAFAEEWYEGMENSTRLPVYNVGQQIPANHEMPLNRIAASLDIQSELAKQAQDHAQLPANIAPLDEQVPGTMVVVPVDDCDGVCEGA